VLQTAIDLLREGIDVFIMADAVSSCNRAEIPIALEALRQAGCQITTTESILFRIVSE
jgi:isochorismate hydrolase